MRSRMRRRPSRRRKCWRPKIGGLALPTLQVRADDVLVIDQTDDSHLYYSQSPSEKGKAVVIFNSIYQGRNSRSRPSWSMSGRTPRKASCQNKFKSSLVEMLSWDDNNILVGHAVAATVGGELLGLDVGVEVEKLLAAPRQLCYNWPWFSLTHSGADCKACLGTWGENPQWLAGHQPRGVQEGDRNVSKY